MTALNSSSEVLAMNVAEVWRVKSPVRTHVGELALAQASSCAVAAPGIPSSNSKQCTRHCSVDMLAWSLLRLHLVCVCVCVVAVLLMVDSI